jgi:hypothetical protein
MSRRLFDVAQSIASPERSQIGSAGSPSTVAGSTIAIACSGKMTT